MSSIFLPLLTLKYVITILFIGEPFSFTLLPELPVSLPTSHTTTPAAIHSLKLSRTHVDWHSVDEVYLYSDATTSKIARTVTQKLGFSKGL